MLKAILAREKVSAAGVLERSELLERVNTLLENAKMEAKDGSSGDGNEEMMCKISRSG
ncbi:hypothetical protein HDV00_005876 [Rhizophlyctis rosea]|nr:hypothetical protein HDV00_005876 [Rhizophlyctis rosea]